MATYILRRLLLMIPTMFGITFIVVAIMLLAPGEPATPMIQGPGMEAGGGDNMKRSKGVQDALLELDMFEKNEEGDVVKKPIHRAWWSWVKNVFALDLGKSWKFERPVLELLGERVPVTVLLNLVSLFLIYVISLPIGIFSATHQGTTTDATMSTGLFVLYSMPSWWVAIMLIVLFGSVTVFDWFPIVGLHGEGYERFTLLEYIGDSAMHLVLPIVCLTYNGFASISRYMRSGMLEVVRQDYIRTARAKGLDERTVIYRHALRNALIPIVTLLGLLLPAMIGGSIIIELIFSIKGMGKLGYDAIFNRDYLVVMANTVVAAVLTLIGLLVTDVLYCVVDPRISLD